MSAEKDEVAILRGMVRNNPYWKKLVQEEVSQTHAEMLEALKLAKNVLFLLHDEVKALGCKAEKVSEKVRAAILKAEGEQ